MGEVLRPLSFVSGGRRGHHTDLCLFVNSFLVALSFQEDDVVITQTSLSLDRVPSSQRRKNIRSIIGTKQLSISTQQAEAQEKARKKRVKEMQEFVSACGPSVPHGDALGDGRKLKTFFLDRLPSVMNNFAWRRCSVGAKSVV